MGLDTSQWLTILGTVVALAVTWGGLLVRVRVAESTLRDVVRGRTAQGERIGILEEQVARLEGKGEQRLKRRTRPVPMSIPEDPSR